MRREFVECKTYTTAYRRCPWACQVRRVAGGFIAFESVTDYKIFINQK